MSDQKSIVKAVFALVAALISGLLLYASYPPLALSGLAWFALTPLLIILPRIRGGLAVAAGYVFGVTSAGLYLYWMYVIPQIPVPAHGVFTLYIAGYYGLFSWLTNRVSRRWGWPLVLTAPVFWVSLEFIRMNAGFLAAPGGLVGHTQYQLIPLIQVAAFSSAYGVSFLVVLINAALADAVTGLQRLQGPPAVRELRVLTVCSPLALGAALVLSAYCWGQSQIRHYHDHHDRQPGFLKVAAVQANIHQYDKVNPTFRQQVLPQYVALTRQAAADRPDLIVWPETAVPNYLQANTSISRAIFALVRETGSPLLVGSAASGKTVQREAAHRVLRNSAVLIAETGDVVAVYHKMKLVPFAEYVPLEGKVSWPSWLVGESDIFTPGDGIQLFESPQGPFGVVICWESLFPEPFRQFVQAGARFMVNLTDETWFDGSQAGRQFLAMATFRAVEHRVAVIRSANTGVSALIDPLGVIRARVTDAAGNDLRVAGVMTVTVPAAGEPTFYTRHGDLFALACLTLAGGLLLFTVAPPTLANDDQAAVASRSP